MRSATKKPRAAKHAGSRGRDAVAPGQNHAGDIEELWITQGCAVARNNCLARKSKRRHGARLDKGEMSPEPKLRQTAKLNALREALVEAGLRTLDPQAAALGLNRNTTWVILSGKHKASGLSARIINRMLTAPNLPSSVRAVVLDYVEEKLAGRYGHKRFRLKQFSQKLAA
jgi:hypothetical protein